MKSVDNMCFFEQLFHRNQSLGAPGYHMKRLKVGTRCASIGLWFNIRFLRISNNKHEVKPRQEQQLLPRRLTF